MPAERYRILLPPKARSGEPVLARDFNRLRDAVIDLQEMVLARTPRPGPDIGVRYGPGGFRSFMKRTAAGGGGDRTVVKIPPLTLVNTRPAYIPAPTGEDEVVPAGHKRVWFRRGGCQGLLAENWDDFFDCPQGVAEEEEDPIPDTWFWAKINLPAGAVLTVSTWEIVSGETFDAFTNAAWPPGGARPLIHYHRLGQVFADGTANFNTGAGGLLVTEHIVNIANNPKPGVAQITKAVFVQREGY